MKFLIQTYNGKITHDFSFTLIQSIEYQNWLNNDNEYMSYILTDIEYMNYLLTNNPIDLIPIGSVEFVHEYFKRYYGIENIKPINVPIELFDFKYSKREIFNGTEKDVKKLSFVKSNDCLKWYTEFTDAPPNGNFQISEIIEDIESEWRSFIYNGKLVGLNNYGGRFDLFPNVELINEMIDKFLSNKNNPKNFTLDVGISEKLGTFVIEVHNFYSCGLYGFAEHKFIPFMFKRSFDYLKLLYGKST